MRVAPAAGRFFAPFAGVKHPAPDPGIFTVKFDRAGRPETVGYGLLMPLAGAR